MRFHKFTSEMDDSLFISISKSQL